MRAGQRLFLSYVALIAAVVVALALATELALRRLLTDVVSVGLRHELALAREIYEQRTELDPDSVADLLGSLTGQRVTIVSRSGVVLGDSQLEGEGLRGAESHAGRPEVREAYAGRIGRAVRTSATVEDELLYLASPTARGPVIRLAVRLQEIDAALARVRQVIFGVGVAALLLASLLSLGFAVAITRPLRRASAAAREMAAGDLSLRVHSARKDELGELADALNSLAAELQRRLAQLEGERAETQALVDAMTEGVLALGTDGALRRANPAARRMFSLPEAPRGLSPGEVSRRPAFRDLVRRALAGETVPPTEIAHAGRSLLATAHPLADGGAVLVFLDVSELRRLEEVRRDFVANASHELKTPLTAIRGFAETLLDEELPPPLRRDFAGKVKANADRLQRIVDDLLDLSRLESGGWRVAPEIVSVEETAREAWSAFSADAERSGVAFAVDVAPEAEFVSADPSALQQVYANLFANALRYTPPAGRIEVAARCLPGGDWVEVSVRDTGAGIPAAHLPRIFERFYRVDAARSRAEGGTGLGLAIVRHLVEGHGGRVEAESELGRGATIRFTLPTPDLS